MTRITRRLLCDCVESCDVWRNFRGSYNSMATTFNGVFSSASSIPFSPSWLYSVQDYMVARFDEFFS